MPALVYFTWTTCWLQGRRSKSNRMQRAATTLVGFTYISKTLTSSPDKKTIFASAASSSFNIFLISTRVLPRASNPVQVSKRYRCHTLSYIYICVRILQFHRQSVALHAIARRRDELIVCSASYNLHRSLAFY